MDLANLDKMKVVDLRNELQTRGLDTKGVKAVLIERLRAHLEGAGVPGSPGTPGRRSRRTRSMTKSPSPSPIKKAPEPALETLEEESNLTSSQDQENTDENVSTPEKVQEDSSKELETKQEDTSEENQIHNLHQEKNHEIAEEAQVEEENTNGAEESQNSAVLKRKSIDENINNDIENEEKVQVNENPTERESNYNEEHDRESKAEREVHEEAHTKSSSVRARSRSKSAERCEGRGRSHSESRSRSRSQHSNSHSRSRSRSRSRSPKRRSGGGGLESPSKTNEDSSTPEDEPTIEDNQFGLSWFDSDLHLRIDPVTFTSAKPMNHDIYALVWSGARTNYGVRDGKVCFEVCLSEETHLNRDHPFRDELHTKGFRVGFSMPSASLLLGESENSFAYCESGRKATNGKFVDFAKPFQLDDVIGCYLDLESTPCTIKYTLNGEDLGVAFEFDRTILGEDQALFPHVLTKGYEYEINLADNDNLLVNKERKIRQRRKEKKVEEKRESEKKVNDDKEAKQSVKENQIEGENVDDEMEEAMQNKTKVLDEKADECNINEGETSNQNDVNMTENTEEEGKDDKEASKTEEASLTNILERTDNAEDEKRAENVETEKSASKSQDDCGPSPSKRQKLDTVEEDEYEEVHPIPRDHMSLLEGYELIALILEEKYIAGPQRPESRKDCEVILMVGLPGAGKTTWVLNHIKDNPDKRYHVIGADALIAKMTVDGVPRKSIHKGRFDRIFELCFNVLTSLEDIAVKRRRNFILDQTNAYASAQRRKMKGFGDFKRIAVVCIPNEEELKRRLVDKKEKGCAYTLKESTLNTLQATFTLPSLEFGWFDDIIFTDLSGEEAKEEVKKYNDKGKKALDEKHSHRDKRQRRDNYRNDNRRRHDDHRRHDYRNDNRWNDRRVGGGYNHGGGGGNRWGSGGGGYRNNSGGYRDDRGYGGGGGGGRGYDQRHQRYSNGPQNWMHNNRNRYGDRNNRYGGSSGGGGAGNRYDSYGGGGGSRDYRSGGGDHRDPRDRNRDNSGSVSNSRRDSHRSGGSNQRDFRHGHRDTREGSRGGSSATSATTDSSKYKSSSAAGDGNDGYEKYNKNSNNQASSNYNSYNHQQQNQPNNWTQYQQHQAVPSGQQQQQQYWNYDTQGYGGNQQQQQQWQAMDPQQQQQWMSWWQQQGNAQQPDSTNAAVDPNHYWSQYSYSTSTDDTKK